MPVTAMFMPSSLQVFLHPRPAVCGLPRWNVFRADPAAVTEAVYEIEKRRKVDLARSGLVPVGNIGDLHMPYSGEIGAQSLAEIVAHHPHMEEVVLQFEIVRVHFVDERERLGGSAEKKARNRVRADRLDEERHLRQGELVCGVAQVGDVGRMQQSGIDVRRRDTGEAVHLLATKLRSVFDCLAHGIPEFADTGRQTAYTAVAFLGIARGNVDENHLDSDVPRDSRELPLVPSVGKLDLDRLESRLRRRLEALGKLDLLEQHADVGAEARHRSRFFGLVPRNLLTCEQTCTRLRRAGAPTPGWLDRMVRTGVNSTRENSEGGALFLIDLGYQWVTSIPIFFALNSFACPSQPPRY